MSKDTELEKLVDIILAKNGDAYNKAQLIQKLIAHHDATLREKLLAELPGERKS